MRAVHGTWRQLQLVLASACSYITITALLAVGPAKAETIQQALASAYRNDPRISSAISQLRAVDESLARAQSGYRPTIFGTADIAAQRVETEQRAFGRPGTVGGAADGESHPKSWSIQASQNLFDGYRTVNGVRQADANIRAQRETLRDTEQRVLLEAVRAFANVIRDRAIVRLRENNVEVLTKELRATEERFAVGEVTKTDVAQARARRAGAISALDLAKANVRASEADYQRVIGHMPGMLEIPDQAKRLPTSQQEAIEVGQSEHPAIVRALFLEEAARHNIELIYGQLLPELRFDATFQQRFDSSTVQEKFEQAQLLARLTIPLYQGGEIAAQVRQAKHQRQSALQDIETARLQVRADVVATWSQLVAARAQLESDNIQVESTRIALEGVREEEKVGQRTLLDVLDAEQEYLNAQVNRVATQRDLVVAGYTVLAAIGRLSTIELGLGEEVYDAEEHYDEVNGKWIGVAIEEEQMVTGSITPPGEAEPMLPYWSTAVQEAEKEPEPDPTVIVDTNDPPETPAHRSTTWETGRR